MVEKDSRFVAPRSLACCGAAALSPALRWSGVARAAALVGRIADRHLGAILQFVKAGRGQGVAGLYSVHRSDIAVRCDCLNRLNRRRLVGTNFEYECPLRTLLNSLRGHER